VTCGRTPVVTLVDTLGAVPVIWKQVILVNWQLAATDSTLNSMGGAGVPRRL
jgi:hypothetical protein